MLEAIAAKLQAASVATTAVDLFIGLMPDTPDECVTLYEYAGSPPMEVFRDDAATLEQPSIQVMVRASRNDYPTARAKIVQVRDVLTGIANETISGVTFLRVAEINAINYLNSDDNDRPRFTQSFSVVMER